MDNTGRTTRELSPETKQQISLAMKNRSKPEHVKQNISQSMKDYWQTVQQ